MTERSWDSDIGVGSPAKLREQVGWQAETDLHNGLRRTLEWFRTNPNLLLYYADRIFPARASV